jgi:hypothetical protein
MRPGMPILLEWQWSPYINKEGNIEKNTKNIDFFDTSKSINELNLEIIKNKDQIKKIIQTIKNPPQGGMVDKLISALNKEFGIPMDRIRKMINKKDGGMIKKFKKGGSVTKKRAKSSKGVGAAIRGTKFKGVF